MDETARWIRFESTAKALVVLLCVTIFVRGAAGHGNRDEHLAHLDAEIEANPDSVALLVERSAALRRLGRYEASLADLERVQAVSPDNHQVYYLRGLTHFRDGNLADAEAALRSYLERVPASSSGHIALAEVLTAQGGHLAAAREYTLAIGAQPTPVPDHYLARAKAYRAAGEPYLELAVEGLDEGMATMGPLVTLQRLAIEIEVDRGNHASAIARIDEILAKAPRKETWLVYKGRILASNGRESEALDAFRLARAAIGSLPSRIRSSPAMATLRATVAAHLEKDTSP